MPQKRFPGRPLFIALIAALGSTVLLLGVLIWHVAALHTMITQKLNAAVETKNDAPQRSAQVTDLPPTRDSALLHLRQGDLLALQGRWKNAEEEYHMAVQSDGGLPALRKLAQAQLQRRDFHAVRFTIDQLRRAGARPGDLLLLEGITMLRTGELGKAETLLGHEQDSPQRSYLTALLSIMHGNHDEAKTALKSAASGWEPTLRTSSKVLLQAYDEYALFPGSPNSHLITLLARALAQVQECEIALPLLSQVTAAEPDYRDAWTVQGYCELVTERSAQARASLERAYALDPEKSEIQYFLARALSAEKHPEQAIVFYQYALKNGFVPEEEVRLALADEAHAMGNLALELEQEEALTNSTRATIGYFRGFVATALASGHEEKAYLKATEAVKRWPTDARAYELLGLSAMKTKRMEEARTALAKALELDPDLVSAKKLLDEASL